MTERSEGAADKVGVAAKRPTERSEGAADAVGVAAKRPTERSEGAADAVGVAAKRPTERSEGAADAVGVAAKRPTERSEGAADAVGVAAKRPTVFAESRRRNAILAGERYLAGGWPVAANIAINRSQIPCTPQRVISTKHRARRSSESSNSSFQRTLESSF